jgi:hypothetical protein
MNSVPASQKTDMTAINTAANAKTTQMISASADVLPNANTLLEAAKIAIEQDKPIQLDYFVDTAKAKPFLVKM